MTPGRYPDMSLKMARGKREQCRSWLADGRDPPIQIKIAKVQTMRPVTGEIPLADCSAQQWIACFDRFKKSPVMAGQIFADAKQALKFCRMRRYAV